MFTISVIASKKHNHNHHHQKKKNSQRSKLESVPDVRHFDVFACLVVTAHFKDEILLLGFKFHLANRLRHLGQRHGHAFFQLRRRREGRV